MVDNNNCLPYAYTSKLLVDLKKSPSFDWLTWNIVNKAFLKFKSEMIEREKKNVVDKGLIGMDIKTKNSGDTALLSDT